MAEVKESTALLSPTRSMNAPHRRTPAQQPPPALYSSKQGRSKSEDSADLSLPALLERHRFLLVAVVILVILCTIYLYFAVSMDMKAEGGYAGAACKGLTGEALSECQERLVSEASKKAGTS